MVKWSKGFRLNKVAYQKHVVTNREIKGAVQTSCIRDIIVNFIKNEKGKRSWEALEDANNLSKL